nr:CidA/LrgA family protein [Levilactobacillus fuyuanensis]
MKGSFILAATNHAIGDGRGTAHTNSGPEEYLRCDSIHSKSHLTLFPTALTVPTPVIDIVLLYILLATHILKRRNVEKFADFIISLTAFLFVPDGVQLAASLDILGAQGLQITAVVLIATIVRLVLVSYTAVGLI